LLVGCNVNGDNDNENPTGVRYNNRGFDTENVRYDYNYNDRLDNVRFDRNGRTGIFDNDFGIDRAERRNGGDADLIDVDYDNAEPDPGEEPNEDRNPAMRGNNDNGLFNGNGNNGMRNGTR